jgi:hypothetical protein
MAAMASSVVEIPQEASQSVRQGRLRFLVEIEIESRFIYSASNVPCVENG